MHRQLLRLCFLGHIKVEGDAANDANFTSFKRRRPPSGNLRTTEMSQQVEVTMQRKQQNLINLLSTWMSNLLF